jgi:hypothetical protein
LTPRWSRSRVGTCPVRGRNELFLLAPAARPKRLRRALRGDALVEKVLRVDLLSRSVRDFKPLCLFRRRSRCDRYYARSNHGISSSPPAKGHGRRQYHQLRARDVEARAFRLAVRAGKVGMRSEFSMLHVDNARKVFFEAREYAAVQNQFPNYLRPVAQIVYITGWRTKSEPLTCQWRYVDLDAGRPPPSRSGRYRSTDHCSVYVSSLISLYAASRRT